MIENAEFHRSIAAALSVALELSSSARWASRCERLGIEDALTSATEELQRNVTLMGDSPLAREPAFAPRVDAFRTLIGLISRRRPSRELPEYLTQLADYCRRPVLLECSTNASANGPALPLPSARYVKALEEYLGDLAEDEPNPRTLLKLGDIFLKLADYSEAVASYYRAARRYTEAGSDMRALSVFEQILSLRARLTQTAETLALIEAVDRERAATKKRLGL